MTTLLKKAIKGEQVTDEDIADELYEICCNVHSSCGSECPIYKIIGDIPWTDDLKNCKYFKNGQFMLERIREYYKENPND